jgi:pyrroloquinoline quinone biosynthesis protein D
MMAPGHVPRLAPGVRLHWDRQRAQWVLQAPEKVVMADTTAAEVLRLVDGRRSLDQLVAVLAERYVVAPDALRQDVVTLLDELMAEGLLR